MIRYKRVRNVYFDGRLGRNGKGCDKMSIENIRSKIISEAGQKAEAALANAQAVSNAIVTEAECKAAEMISEAEKNGNAEKEKLIARKKSVADIDGRKLLLEKKQEIIAYCFEKAADRIVSMEKEKYITFLAGLVRQTGETDGQLIFGTNDREKIGAETVRYLNENITGGSFTLSEETKPMKGGLILRKGQVSVNCTIENLLEEAGEELTGEVAARLFGCEEILI